MYITFFLLYNAKNITDKFSDIVYIILHACLYEFRKCIKVLLYKLFVFVYVQYPITIMYTHRKRYY